MNFWLRKYKIRLENLPYSLLIWSALVAMLCLGILSAILLLLPIQDKIKGDVQIYTSGQPIPMNAPSAGFLFLHKDEHELIKKGDLIATIDVEIDKNSLDQLEELIYRELATSDLEFSSDMIEKINFLTQKDFRQINNELFNLSDLIKQLSILKKASDPKGLLTNLDRSISLKVKQLGNYKALNQSQKDVLDLIKGQISADSTLHAVGGISERELQEARKNYMDKQSVLIENALQQQTISGAIIEDEKEKYVLVQEHQSKIEELKLRIVDQIGVIRKRFREYVDEYIVLSPATGYASLPYGRVNQETVLEGDPILFLSRTQNAAAAKSEMYVGADNAGKIKAGMVVRVGLSEFDQKEYGIYYTTVKDISQVQQDGSYRVTLDCELPLSTSYEINLPARNTYSGDGEILLGKINLLTKISREIYFNKAKYASL